MTDAVLRLDDLTIDDLEEVEKLTGRPASTLFTKAGAPADMAAVKAVVCVLMRHTDPDFSLVDAGKVKVSSLQVGSDNAPLGTNGSSSSPPSPTPTTTHPSRSGGSRSSRRTR